MRHGIGEREGRFLVFFVWRPRAGFRICREKPDREGVGIRVRRARVVRLPSLLGDAGERRLPAWAAFAAPGGDGGFPIALFDQFQVDFLEIN
jgi:hypothetical protein